MAKIRFVTDSTCDIPADLIQKYNISVVPVFINYNDKSYADDGVELVRETYYNQIGNIHPHPSTSAMSPGMAEKAILEADKDADYVIIATVASTLSGVNNAMRLGAQNLPEERYTLIDSKSVSMGLGFQVLIGAETAEKTGGDVQATLAAMRSASERSLIYCALHTLEYLRRSGRVSWAQANIGALLQIKPIIEVRQGVVNNVGRVRTFKRALEDLYRLCKEASPIERLAILHANNPTDAKELYESLKSEIAPPDTLIVGITPAIGTNIGPGGVGVAMIQKAK